MAYGKVFVAGGAKGVGRAVIDKLVDQGSEVVALVRREDAKDELEAIKGRWIESNLNCFFVISSNPNLGVPDAHMYLMRAGSNTVLLFCIKDKRLRNRNSSVSSALLCRLKIQPHP